MQFSIKSASDGTPRATNRARGWWGIKVLGFTLYFPTAPHTMMRNSSYLYVTPNITIKWGRQTAAAIKDALAGQSHNYSTFPAQDAENSSKSAQQMKTLRKTGAATKDKYHLI